MAHANPSRVFFFFAHLTPGFVAHPQPSSTFVDCKASSCPIPRSVWTHSGTQSGTQFTIQKINFSRRSKLTAMHFSWTCDPWPSKLTSRNGDRDALQMKLRLRLNYVFVVCRVCCLSCVCWFVDVMYGYVLVFFSWFLLWFGWHFEMSCDENRHSLFLSRDILLLGVVS